MTPSHTLMADPPCHSAGSSNRTGQSEAEGKGIHTTALTDGTTGSLPLVGGRLRSRLILNPLHTGNIAAAIKSLMFVDGSIRPKYPLFGKPNAHDISPPSA